MRPFGTGEREVPQEAACARDPGRVDRLATRLLLDQLATVGSLADHYAYAPELGLALRGRIPVTWGCFKEQDPTWRPKQADGLAFCAYLETLPERSWLDQAAALISVEPIWSAELEESIRFAGRPAPPEMREGSRDLVPVPAARLYAPQACLHYAQLGGAYPELGWALEALPEAKRCVSAAADAEALALAHPRPFVDAIERYAALGFGALDPDTPVGAGLGAALRAGAGALVTATRDGLAAGPGLRLCAARPGSHHAGIARPMGTCVFNNLAIAGTWALERNRRRIAIVDFDAHHGNGTREIFADQERVLTISLHQDPLYPSTAGRLPDALGNLDLPLAPGSGPKGLATAWACAVEALESLRPELILVEASFDAHEDDAVSELGWRTCDFEQIGEDLGLIARANGAPIVCEIGSGLMRAPFQESLNGFARAALARLD